MAKNDNMLAILWMLNSGAKITAKQIAEKLEINIRTVYRYIDSLCASGVPIISDSGLNGGYRLLNHSIQAPLFFNADEQKALLHAAELAKGAGYPFHEVLCSATDKLKLYANQKQENALNRHTIGFEVVSRAIDPSMKLMLEEIEQSVANETSVEIIYRKKREEQSLFREIDPYGIIFWNNRWYTIGLCHLRNEIRSFRVDRISQLNTTKAKFKRPEHFSGKGYFLQQVLPDTADINGMSSIIISGKEETLDDLCNHWFLGHYFNKRSLKEAVFLINEQFTLEYVPYFLLSYGKSIQVLEPLSLKQKMVSLAMELMEYYKI